MSADASVVRHIDKVCHDLKQHIAIGLLLSQPDGEEHLGAYESRRLTMLRQQWEQAADLVSLLDAGRLEEEYAARGRHRSDLLAVTRHCVDSVPVAHVVVLEAVGDDHVVVGDPVQLRRAVTNLLDNACRAAAATGGRVTVRVASSDTGSWVEVTDEGPGFGEIPGGTGLGLEIVGDAIRASGGRLQIETAPGGGTLVRMTLPAALRPVR